ncbi:MAG: CAP domain-containing protein [Nannocystaceae bacterium]
MAVAVLASLPGCGTSDDSTTDAGTESTMETEAGTDPSQTGTDAGSETGSDTSANNDPVWDSAYCQPVSDTRPVNPWLPDWGSREAELLELVNALRASGTTCGGQAMPAVGPLTMEASLQCAARVHSLDMSVRDFFSHDNPDGESPFDRMGEAGYIFAAAGENIAAGVTTPADAMALWESSSGHCTNMMSPDYAEFGAGFIEGDGEFGTYWTQTFGRPLSFARARLPR